MSKQCKLLTLPLSDLKPAWVEFTSTAGVLRVLQPKDSRSRAAGLVFNCPRCRHSKQKAHYCIFLFDTKATPEQARPHGRFTPTLETDPVTNMRVPENFGSLTLIMDGVRDDCHLLEPGDLKCKWQGKLLDGKVIWRPSFGEKYAWR